MWEEIRANKRNSFLLMILVSLVLVGFSAFIGALLGSAWHGIIIGFIVAMFLSLIAFFQSDQIILSMSNAAPVTHEEFPQLYNVVDEMRIAAGLPMPKVYLIHEAAPNAFATGRNPERASVAVTSGLMTKLNREELQAVTAHEMSHVRHYDIRFAMILAVMVGAIVMLSQFFLRFGIFGMRGARRSRGRGGGAAQVILLLVAIVFAILAPLMAKLIELAASRRREYLADAGAAELTRNPLALASALEKIATDRAPLESANGATQHLYIVNPLKPLRSRSSVFSTHPPIEERIRRLRQMAYQFADSNEKR